ncbi:uncharacterized protein LOC103712349 [Phoenix dactylifera]|uniref:Uncharacterized protein LOC103712349 n=1 Tax=Phoenix dactylifera TaxID=42345 RepID=A0A8B8ZCM7_PHODC|nr:uncharacterized protein LOC103712349 [Phoenix dactylifera]
MAILRLKKGLKEEVLSKSESWRLAEIISGNGRTYIVKYDGHQPGMAEVTERVPRKVIRPLPPSMDGVMYWSPGDTVEALEDHSWKLAQVSNRATRDYYFVTILGSSKHIIAHKSELRVRQAWKDNHWVIIQKDAARFEDGNLVKIVVEEEFNTHVPHPSRKGKNHEVERQAPHNDYCGFVDGQRKRRCIYLSEHKHDSSSHAENGFANAPRELNDAQSVSSSIGNCSPCRSPYTSCCNPATCRTRDMDNLLDDANACVLAAEEKYNEAMLSTAKRLVAAVEGLPDPGGPKFQENKRESNFKTREETEEK